MAWGKAGSNGVGENLYRLKHGHDVSPSPRYREKNQGGTVSDITSDDWDVSPTNGVLVEEWTGNQTASAPSWAQDMWSGSTSQINGHSITARRYAIPTASTTADNLAVNVSNNKTLQVLSHHRITSGNGNPYMRMNGHIDTKYDLRHSMNGGADSTGVTNTNRGWYGAVAGYNTNPYFEVNYFVNISAEEKIGIGLVGHATAGDTAPERAEKAVKLVDTSNPISVINWWNQTENGQFDDDSNITSIGSDITPVDPIVFPTNVQVGSKAEITDTRKIYYYDDIGWRLIGETPFNRKDSWYEHLTGETP